MKQLRKRLTYANVMSSLSVFLVLGGATAFAATKIGSKEIKANAITAGKIKKEAVTAAKLKNGAVTTAKIAPDAVTGSQVNEATLGQVPSAAQAGNTSALGGRPAGDYAVRAFARVTSSSPPTLAAGSPGVQVDPVRPFTGGVDLIFPMDMSNCAVVGTAVTSGPPILVRQSGSIDGNRVRIVTETPEGAVTDQAFNLIAVC